ncbi:MAG: protein translocase subunit SecF [Hyphomicrobiales bacterium]|nr:protein translocase subunit SecF [Hyphomicrobiales bacterium]
MLLRFIPAETNIPFMGMRRISYPVSIILAIVSLGLFFSLGLNTGIDFRGGTLIEIRTTDGPADIGGIRSTVGTLNLGDVQIQEFGEDTDVLIRIERQPGGEEAQQAVVSQVQAVLGTEVEYRRVEVVGPRVSGELTRAGAIAVVTAILAVLFYIWIRFEWQFAVGAIIALVHDVILTIGLFAITRLEFNLASIAAILTIVGYSLNDTVVVYDRIREKLRKYKKMPLSELLDLAVNKTLSRTIMTSVTTLLALGSLAIFGGEVIRSFIFAMMWGVLIGTYSSIFIAAPVLMMFGLKRSSAPVKAEGAPAPGE